MVVATVILLVAGWDLSRATANGCDARLSSGVECGVLEMDCVAERRRRGSGDRVRVLDLDVAWEAALVGTAGKAE